MKVLIAYDGSACSETAVEDLRYAGLPADAEVVVLTAAETSPQLAAASYGAMATGPGIFLPEAMGGDEWYGKEIEECCTVAKRAVGRLQRAFANWHIETEGVVDAAAPAIVQKVLDWQPDLLVLGSHGRSGISRFVLGSVSQDVLHRVPCSVRISRRRTGSEDGPVRLMIGVDGSPDSAAAVQSVSHRYWSDGAEACVVGVYEHRNPLTAAAGVLVGASHSASDEESRTRISAAVHSAARTLHDAGLRTAHRLLAGRPADVLVAEADKFGADCLFVGARGHSILQRLVAGNVSSAIAAHAQCSVEIVRPQ